MLKVFPDTNRILPCLVAKKPIFPFFVAAPGVICFIVHLELCFYSFDKVAGYEESSRRGRENFSSLRRLLSILKTDDLREMAETVSYSP